MRTPSLSSSAMIAAFCAAAISFGQQPKHKVFAHYMVCCPFQSPDIAGFKQDIRDAQAAGIDGFALNCGAWFSEPGYITKSRALYDAAEQLGTGFKLFFSVDGCCGNTDSVARDMVRSFGRLPAQFLYQGKIFFSAWDFGNQSFYSSRFATVLKPEGYDVYVVPYVYTNPESELPDSSVIVQNCNGWWKDVFDGYFYFGAAGLPAEINMRTRVFTKTLHALGKTFMAPVSPTYWGQGQPSNGRRYYEYQGGEGTESQWNTIISSQPDWVEIVTWNDANESYICPALNDNQSRYYYNSGAPRPFAKPHIGYLKLSQYFIQWYKAGVKPPVTANSLFYFYRTHPKDAVASGDPQGAVTDRYGTVEDVIYLTTIAKDSLDVRVTTGGTQRSVMMAPGIRHARVPFTVGTQRIEAYRKGVRVIDLTGESIVSNISYYNFFMTSGFGVDSSGSGTGSRQGISNQPPSGMRENPDIRGARQAIFDMRGRLLDRSTVRNGQCRGVRILEMLGAGESITISVE